MERVEELGIRKIMTRKHQSIPMCANVDLYSGLIYSMLDIPEDMTIPMFFFDSDFEPGAQLENVGLLDLAPTIAKLIGVPPAREWEGRSIV